MTAVSGPTGSYPVGRDETTKTRTRAPGLDGVRALAVLAVMGFHEGASELTGGFLGVDIFFVLSGFLITDLLAARYEESGRLDLRDFWSRRARRLLPALAVMLVVVTAAATVIEPAQDGSLRLALLAAATYTSNWYQILHHVSYFDMLGPPPPLDHLWSLAIEEQFYLIWPLILWFGVLRLNGRNGRVGVTLAGAAMSALAMALQYTPGSDPSAVYYGTDTHASALLIGSALALACPLRSLAAVPAALARRMDVAGVAGLAFLAWATGHFSGDDPAVYPVGLVLTAAAAAALAGAAAGTGVIAAITGWAPLRWLGTRSYGIYLWHWPVIALTAALTRPGADTPWAWAFETAVTVVLAAASWRFIETPILRNGFRATCRHWGQRLTGVGTRQAGRLWRSLPAAVAGAVVLLAGTAGYGLARPASAAPAGLLRQVAQGERVSAASRAARAGSARPGSARGRPAQDKPARAGSPGTRPASGRSCRPGAVVQVPGDQVTAVGDSVMVASAAALAADLPGIYIDAQVGRQMTAGLAIVRELAASGGLRRIVVIGLGTNGTVTAAELSQLRDTAGPHRELVLVNTYGPMSWEPEVNAVLAAAARHGDGHVELANWHKAIAAQPGLLWPDGIHPQPSGARLYARVVLAAIRAGLRAARSSCR